LAATKYPIWAMAARFQLSAFSTQLSNMNVNVLGSKRDAKLLRKMQRSHRYRIYTLYIAGGWLLPGRKRVVPYSIQTLKRLKPEWFRQELIALFDLVEREKIKPLIALRLPLAEARHAQELLGKGGVTGKIVLVRTGPSLGSGAS
jgi:NADPH:quinone reductase-like Zn-dependent oxidoreductase